MTVREFIESGILANDAVVAVENSSKEYNPTEFMGCPQSLLTNMDSWYQNFEIKSVVPEFMNAFSKVGLLITI